MRFEMVKKIAEVNLDVTVACETLKVSCSGYYRWKKNPPSTRALDNKRLSEKIIKLHKASRGTYGVPRMYENLRADGETCSKKRVERLMKKLDLSGIARKRFRVKTTDSNHDLPIAERIFKTEEAQEQVTRPHQVWASDITYIQTDEGWVYLVIFLDLFTRKVVGFSMAEHMRVSLVLNALEMALGRTERLKGQALIGHSDRGSQYAAENYRERLAELSITASMSRKANCYDNAFAESFFHTLKVELVYRTKFKTRNEAIKIIFEYIEVWYNRQRLHSSLGYKTPVEYESSHQQLTALAA